MMKKVYNYLMVILLPLGMYHSTYAQQLSVSGKIIDSNTKEGIAGANVVIKGTSRGTITDIDGNFSIDVERGKILVISFVSYLTEEIEVTSATMNVELNEDITNLEEVVISGLASSVKRSNLANAVGTVSAEELVGTTGQSTIDGALYGKLTGVNITQSSGAPGGGVAMRLRGVSSIFGNNQPLFIIDGVYMNNSEIASGSRFASGANNGAEENASNRLADLDPNDIETIEVLKG
ncbi:MAG: carboxypeptidase-like regulatory domain-containing protein, partial [Cytophagales bacterium]|nr:carboxypeptidase-like regulatory domain-containing protein [Cytophagales bacterium]